MHSYMDTVVQTHTDAEQLFSMKDDGKERVVIMKSRL